MDVLNPADFKNWLPNKLFERDGRIMLRWIYLWDFRFEAPFFDEALARCVTWGTMNGTEHHEPRITPVEFLGDVADIIDYIEPDLFIFHTSRCGSTITTQILSMDEQNIVYPEYILVDSILRATIDGENVTREKRKEWLKNLIRVMGQRRFEAERRLIIKLDSWHFCYYDMIRELYPDIPFAIMYREPEAILQSNNKRYGMQFLPDIISPLLYNIELKEMSQLSINEYANQVLQWMYKTIKDIAFNDQKCILLDYCNGVEENLKCITDLLQIDRFFMKSSMVRERLKFHSKKPEDLFTTEAETQNIFSEQKTKMVYKQLVDFSQSYVNSFPKLPYQS